MGKWGLIYLKLATVAKCTLFIDEGVNHSEIEELHVIGLNVESILIPLNVDFVIKRGRKQTKYSSLFDAKLELSEKH